MRNTQVTNEINNTGEQVIIKEEVNPIAYVMIGVGITLFAVCIAFLIGWCVLKQRRKNDRIVVVDETTMQRHGTMILGQTDPRAS